MKELSDALMKTLVSTQVPEFGDDYRYLESANVVDGLFAIAQQLGKVAYELRQLGFGDANGRGPGALEGLGMFVRDHAESVDGVAKAITQLADVMDGVGSTDVPPNVPTNVEAPRG